MPNQIYLVRHGDTEWSPIRRLAGRMDLPLTAIGDATAREVGKRLAGLDVARAYTSPLVRARRTAELAGFAGAVVDPRLVEMDFGRYEGKTVHEIRSEAPGWTYLGDGCPGGETAADLAARVDPVIAELRAQAGISLVFAHSVTLRVLTARYLGLPPAGGRNFMLAPGGVCILEHDVVDDAPAVKAWNLGAAAY